MQISFNPCNPVEVDAVRRFIDVECPVDQQPLRVIDMSKSVASGVRQAAKESEAETSQMAADFAARRRDIAQADRPDVGADAAADASALINQAVGNWGGGSKGTGPFLSPDAPLPAAADLFETAPAAPLAGAPSATTVPSPPAVPAPPTAAPTVVASPAPRAENGDLDNSGLPWDARIHSGTKAKNADGSWRQRRGLNDPDLVKRVEVELRALMAIPKPESTGVDIPMNTPIAPAAAVSAVPFPPPAPSTNATEPTAIHGVSTAATTSTEPAGNVPPPPVPAPVASARAIAPIPSPPAVPAFPTAAAPAAPITFPALMRKLSDGIAQRKFTEADVHEALADLDLQPTDIGKLSANADLLAKMNVFVDELLGVTS